MDALVEEVLAASAIPPKSRATSIKPTVAELTSRAYEEGVLPGPLAELVALAATPTHLDQASIGAIVRALYPAAAVPADTVVLRVVGCLGHGRLRPGLQVQALLLRWLLMVYHVLDDRAVLSRAYGVLFNLLDTAALRPHLCHLLALITRRKHVRPFRIQALLELSRATGGDLSLTGLLRVYKDYYPEIILGEAVRGRASAFRHPDLEWRERLDEIQRAHARATEGAAGPAGLTGFRVARHGLDRAAARKASGIPGVRTTQATEASVTLEEIDGAESLVANLEKIELPNQLVAVLADPLLQKLLTLRPSEESSRRIGGWLRAGLQDGDADRGAQLNMLRALREYVLQTKHMPAVLLAFFRDFLPGWDGKDGRDEILDMLQFVPPAGFDDLYRLVFRPLEAAALDNTAESQLRLLSLYTGVLRHWTALVLATKETETEAVAPPPPSESRREFLALAADSLSGLVDHAGTLGLAVITQAGSGGGSGGGGGGVAAELAALGLYQHAAALYEHPILHNAVRIVLPPSQLVYAALIGHSAATLSRLCAVFAAYKRAFELAMADAGPETARYDRLFVNRFNSFLVDICNCLWRSRAFSTDGGAMGLLVPQPLVPRLAGYVAGLEPAANLPSLLDISHSPVLCRLAILSLRAREDAARAAGAPVARHAGPVTQRSLAPLGWPGDGKVAWQEYRIGVLEYLQAQGLGGVSAMMMNAMKVLMNPGRDRS